MCPKLPQRAEWPRGRPRVDRLSPHTCLVETRRAELEKSSAHKTLAKQTELLDAVSPQTRLKQPQGPVQRA